jgi:type VI protein secretion system component Hcp
MKPMKILVPTVAALGAATAVAIASIPGSDPVITGCYYSKPDGSKPFGTLRVLDPSDTSGNLDVTSCVTDESTITWNQEGPTGPQGDQGPKGAPGTGLTIASPSIKPTATPVGHVKLGIGDSALRFDVLSVGFAPRGGGGASAKVKFHDFQFVKKVDKASPKLAKACANGRHFDKATIVARKAGGDPHVFLKYKLSQVLVSSYETLSGGSGEAKSEEAISLNFGKIKIEYSQ